MMRHTRWKLFHGLLLATLGIMILSVYCSTTRALSGSIPGNVANGSAAYYKVGGWTHNAFFQISFTSTYTLEMRLYTDEGDLVTTGSVTSSTTRQIYEYLSGGYTYYIAIIYVSGTGAASFTLTYQDVYTIAYYGTTPPFTTGVDQLTALAIGAPIILGVGFAIIGIFGRMKIRQRKSEVSLGVPSQVINLAPATSPSPPPVRTPVPISTPPAPVVTTPEIKYCPYCGYDVPPGSTTCKSCGNALK